LIFLAKLQPLGGFSLAFNLLLMVFLNYFEKKQLYNVNIFPSLVNIWSNAPGLWKGRGNFTDPFTIFWAPFVSQKWLSCQLSYIERLYQVLLW